MWVHSLFCWMNCLSMYILGIKDWLLALFIYLLDGDIFLASSHEQNMMPTLLWTWFAFSYTTELICSILWFDLLAAVTKLTSTVYQWHLNKLATASVSSSLFLPFGIYMSMPIVCSCIQGNDVFSAIHAYEIFLIYTCGDYIDDVFSAIHAYEIFLIYTCSDYIVISFVSAYFNPKSYFCGLNFKL